MNSRNVIIASLIIVAVSFVAVQAFASPSYYGWGSMSTMGNGGQHMNQGGGSGMMNGQGMMGGMMNGQSMNYQQCQQYMGPEHNMTVEQCEAMYQQYHT